MTKQMTKKEIAESKTMTEHEKQKLLNELREPYKAMSDEELLQLVRDFTEENGREPTRDDLVYTAEAVMAAGVSKEEQSQK